MRIGELARELGVSADTLRFYERSGFLPRLRRGENGYRDYSPSDVERIRLMLDLRRLDVGVGDAARLAGWCHTGHCPDMSEALPAVLAARRDAIRDRISGLQELDRRLAQLEAHLTLSPLAMAGADGPCCPAAEAIVGVASR